eukprot:2341104-Pyramimonas_sp.AAC.2
MPMRKATTWRSIAPSACPTILSPSHLSVASNHALANASPPGSALTIPGKASGGRPGGGGASSAAPPSPPPAGGFPGGGGGAGARCARLALPVDRGAITAGRRC